MSIQKQMSEELKSKEIFEQARSYAFEYIDGIKEMDVFPSELQGKAVIRISVCSWITTENDIKRTIELFKIAEMTVPNNV